MRFTCRPVDATFFDTAPWRFEASAEIAASAEGVFEIFEDAAAWPAWFEDIEEVTWTSPRPFHVGTTRTVRLQSAEVDEHFFRWDSGRGFSFFFAAASLPIFRALAEDYELLPLGPDRCRFRYRMCIDPGLVLRLLSPLMRRRFGKMVEEGPAALARWIDEGSPRR